ncbi:MAG TPA: prolyl oligopeptidase family serine peptidase, partial [Povalibacter sp.]|nr:prolyl oligopeptidase family serine peptidase [Povalibacter sp.]
MDTRAETRGIRQAFCVLTLLLTHAASAQSTAEKQAAASTTAPAASEPAALISAEDFGALPFLTSPNLSPSGNRMAARAYNQSALKLVVIDFSGAAKAIIASLPIPSDRDLLWVKWAGENRLLFSVGKSERFEGEDLYVRRLMMYDLATSKMSFVGKASEGIVGDDVIHVDRDGGWLLLSIQETITEYPSVWRVDLNTLEMKKIVRPRPEVWDWFADHSGVVRAGIGTAANRWWLLYRKTADDDFRRISRKTSEDEENGDVEKFIPLDASDNGYVIANKRTGRFALYRYNFATDTIGEPVYEHPQVDIDDFALSEQGELQAVYYTDDRSRVEWFNPEMKKIQADIDQAVPDRINRVVSMNRDHTRMIVWTGSASDPGRYYMYTSADGVMKLLSKPYDRLTGRRLANVESVSYAARDGLQIPAYLTVPAGREIKALPMVMMPHGGPFARDEWEYDIWAQFLANRGYLVLQPNYRGSTGYGKAFVDKGVGQWGRGMQDDIDDGVKWLVAQGKVDPKRVCIMGASFGGYAAMWAAVRNPDIYRCAISFAGVADIDAMLRYDRQLFSATRYYRN